MANDQLSIRQLNHPQDVTSRFASKESAKQEDIQSNAQASSPSLGRNNGELFPQINPRFSNLPEHGETSPNFDRNAYSSAPRSKSQDLAYDPLLHLPKVGGYYVAKIIGQSYDLHLQVLENQYKVFKVTLDGQEQLRDEQLELIKQDIANGKIEANWSYWTSALEFCALAGQAAVGGSLLLSGNTNEGAAMLGSTACQVAGKLLRSQTDYYKTGVALQTLGTLSSAAVGTKNLAGIAANNLPKNLASSLELTFNGGQLYTEYKKNKT
ncbi:MAG: hypothetical protein KDK71_10430, partial [Chlamydiia bacterium]|nr:hypothetical protein [Chlamydiia bacterium]